MKTKKISREWAELIKKGNYKIKYRKGDPDWMFDALGWKKNVRRT